MRLLVAIVGASLAMPIIAFLVAVGFTMATGELNLDGGRSNFLGNPLVLLVVAGIVVLPTSFALVVMLIFLTRWCVRRGYASLGLMTMIGAALGSLTMLVSFLDNLILFRGYPVQDDRLGTMAELILLLVCVAGGAITGAVYWLLLDPPSYYRDSHVVSPE